MESAVVSDLFMWLALLILLSAGLAVLLERFHVPGAIAALLVSVSLSLTPFAGPLIDPARKGPFTLLVELAVLFLLFLVGLEIDPVSLRGLSRPIFFLTVASSLGPFLLGLLAMWWFGYDLGTAALVGMILLPTAEIVIIPILEEVGLLETRAGRMIVGAGTLDDVLEAVLLAIVSLRLSQRTGGAGAGPGSLWTMLLGASGFAALALLGRRFIVPFLRRRMQHDSPHLVTISVLVMLGFGGLADRLGLGIVLGALIAGAVMRPAFVRAKQTGTETTKSLRSISEGFLGLVFFLWVGQQVDLHSVLQTPWLTALLCLAGSSGKLLGAFTLVPFGRLSWREAIAVGVGLNARLTTEVVVAQLLYSAGAIGAELFSALVAASSIMTIVVPIAFSAMARAWGVELAAQGRGESVVGAAVEPAAAGPVRAI